VTTEWIVVFAPDAVVRVMDWKATDRYDADLPSVEEMRFEGRLRWRVVSDNEQARTQLRRVVSEFHEARDTLATFAVREKASS